MTNRGYTVLGWAVWQLGSRLVRRRLRQNRTKIALATGAVVAVTVAGAIARRQTGAE